MKTVDDTWHSQLQCRSIPPVNLIKSGGGQLQIRRRTTTTKNTTTLTHKTWDRFHIAFFFFFILSVSWLLDHQLQTYATF